MFIASSLDSFLVFLVFTLSIIGFIRGFLKEIASIINWFGSFYLISVFKPFVVPLLKDKIQIPFLLDITVNSIIFVILIIVISILNNYLISMIKKVVPNITNNGLGFLFGFMKGLLITGFIVAFLNIVYKKTTQLPMWLDNSYIYNSVKIENSIFSNIIESILGDLNNVNKKIEISNSNTNKNIEKIKDKIIEKTTDLKDDIGDNIEEMIKNDKRNINNKDIEKLINIIAE